MESRIACDFVLSSFQLISSHIYDQAQPERYARRQVSDAKKKAELSVNENGKPYISQNNIRIALLKLGVTVRHDRFADRVLLDGLEEFGPTLDDAAMTRLRLKMEQRFKFKPSKEMFYDIVGDAARLNGFHPVCDYLDGLKWDGVKRLDNWLTTYGDAESTKYTQAVGALMLIAAVRRVRQPGCKFDEMLVLESDQGTNRSTALSILAIREEWFHDDLPLNLKGKEVIEALRGRWIIEAAELSGMRKADIEHLKAFLSRRI